jgi:hypothetical protein
MELQADLKQDLHRIIDKVENISTLEEVYNILQKEVQEEDKVILGYINGKAVDKQSFIKNIKEAEARIDKGEFITQEDLEKEAANW